MGKKLLSLIVTTLIILIIPFLTSACSVKTVVDDNSSLLKVHYIDVGQGDSILITVNNKSLLIDAGPRESEKQLLNYLKEQNLNQIDYVISTHPHEDHIGSMDKIISNFKIGKFYSPKIVSNTKSYESMIESLIDDNMKINVLKAGTTGIDLGKDVVVTVLSPNRYGYDNINNFSPIIKIEYKETSFLFTGDAEEEIENEVLKSNTSLKSDVLKLGHHGSSTSTSEEFYKEVNPSISIISCGRDNKYNHPSSETKELLKKYRTQVFRTDLDGTILLESDGKNIKAYTSKF